jgi:methionyl-tRNA formyltransferase
VLLKILRAEPIENTSATPGKVLSASREGFVIACGEGALRILELQREGGKRLTAQQFLAGHPIPIGERFV